jgi:hypothetical protein
MNTEFLGQLNERQQLSLLRVRRRPRSSLEPVLGRFRVVAPQHDDLD